MLNIKRIDHIQICIPIGEEENARKFYGEILGLNEIPKPETLVKNGGLWFKIGEIELHIGVEDIPMTKSKRHPAFEVENLAKVRAYLELNHVKIKEDTVIPHVERFSIFDPWGNRIELLEKVQVHSEEVKLFWQEFILKFPEYKFHKIPKTDSFCNDEINTNELANLVKKGIKTASCGALIDYRICNDPLPFEGELKIIVNWNKEPVCITKIKKVEIKKFNEVSEEFAKKEGEGDLSYNYWHRVHTNYFSAYLNTFGLKFTEEIELVCEEFELLG